MSDLFVVTCSAGLLILGGGMVLAYLGDWQQKKKHPSIAIDDVPPGDVVHRAHLELIARVGNGRKS